MGGATSKPASDVVCLLVSVAYHKDVKRENLTFWLSKNFTLSRIQYKM